MVLGLSAAISLVFATSAAPTNPPVAHTAVSAPAIHRVIVKLRATGSAVLSSAAREQRQGMPSEAIAALAARNEFTLGRTRNILPGLHVMEIAPQSAGESLQASLARLRADPAVEYAEPDQRRHVLVAPNDPLFAPGAGSTGQWYLQNSSMTASDVDATDAWAFTTGSTGLVIADIDTGVRFDHPDLLRAGTSAGGRLLRATPLSAMCSRLTTARSRMSIAVPSGIPMPPIRATGSAMRTPRFRSSWIAQ